METEQDLLARDREQAEVLAEEAAGDVWVEIVRDQDLEDTVFAQIAEKKLFINGECPAIR